MSIKRRKKHKDQKFNSDLFILNNIGNQISFVDLHGLSNSGDGEE